MCRSRMSRSGLPVETRSTTCRGIVRAGHLIAGFGQQLRQQTHVGRLVVDHQNARSGQDLLAGARGSSRKCKRHGMQRLYGHKHWLYKDKEGGRLSRMVRRDEADRRSSASRCSSPAGASPVSVSAGAPSSRPQASGESPVAQAGCQKPLRREPARGPQHQVKPAASTELQSESRAAHVTAKATSADAAVRRCTCGRSRRGTGRSTRARRGTEHERPVCAALVRAARLV